MRSTPSGEPSWPGLVSRLDIDSFLMCLYLSSKKHSHAYIYVLTKHATNSLFHLPTLHSPQCAGLEVIFVVFRCTSLYLSGLLLDRRSPRYIQEDVVFGQRVVGSPESMYVSGQCRSWLPADVQLRISGSNPKSVCERTIMQ